MEPRAQPDPASQPARLRPLVLAQLPDLRVDRLRQKRPVPPASSETQRFVPPPAPQETSWQEDPRAENNRQRVDFPADEYCTPPAPQPVAKPASQSAAPGGRYHRYDGAHRSAGSKGRHSHSANHAALPRPLIDDHTEEFSSPLLRLNQQIKPYAGLIVTLALITSGCLMYWMMDNEASTVPRVQEYSETYGANTFSLPDFSGGEDTLNSPALPQDEWVPEEPSAQQSAPSVASMVEMESETAPCPLPPCDEGETNFPTTSHPESLDFTRLNRLPEGEIMPQALPPVAQLPGENASETTHR